MSQLKPFRSSIGKKITFGEAGTWVLIEHLCEEVSQSVEEWYEQFGDISTARGTFKCENDNSRDQTAIMRIFVQIPHSGSFFYTPQERAEQASKVMDRTSSNEINSYQRLKERDCKSTRPLLGSKVEEQDEDGLVPGGYLAFLLLGEVPGTPLDDTIFWKLPLKERGQIRESFRIAWEDCTIAGGVLPAAIGLHDLAWDKEHSKIYITRARAFEFSSPDLTWKDTMWLAYRLALPPRGYRYSRETQAHPDTSNWKM